MCRKTADLQSAAVASAARNPIKMESVRGFEPLFARMKTWCPRPLDDTDEKINNK